MLLTISFLLSWTRGRRGGVECARRVVVRCRAPSRNMSEPVAYVGARWGTLITAARKGRGDWTPGNAEAELALSSSVLLRRRTPDQIPFGERAAMFPEHHVTTALRAQTGCAADLQTLLCLPHSRHQKCRSL